MCNASNDVKIEDGAVLSIFKLSVGISPSCGSSQQDKLCEMIVGS